MKWYKLINWLKLITLTEQHVKYENWRAALKIMGAELLPAAAHHTAGCAWTWLMELQRWTVSWSLANLANFLPCCAHKAVLITTVRLKHISIITHTIQLIVAGGKFEPFLCFSQSISDYDCLLYVHLGCKSQSSSWLPINTLNKQSFKSVTLWWATVETATAVRMLWCFCMQTTQWLCYVSTITMSSTLHLQVLI